MARHAHCQSGSMAQLCKLFSAAVIVGALAAPASAAQVTIAWDPNPTSDNVTGYLAGYTEVASSTTVCPTNGDADTFVPVSPATSTTFTITTLAAGKTYCIRVYALNANGRSNASNTVGPYVASGSTPPPTGGGLKLERGRLSFGGVRSGSAITVKTPSQTILVTQTQSGAALSWTATTSNSRISVSPTSGSGSRALTVSLASTNLATGTYDDTVTVTVNGTVLTTNVRTRVYNAGSTTVATGFFDTPANNATGVVGAIPVTGWALDDIGVARVDVYRDGVGAEGGAQIYLGTAAFSAGSRPDVEAGFDEYPMNYRAGWGFMVLTNMLPNASGSGVGGNGTFRLRAYAVDHEGNSAYLGDKTFTSNNSTSMKPFGTLDTPGVGATISGSAYAVFGWALSRGGLIPINGSTIDVYIDGTYVGHPVYNQNRADIQSLFPGFANSNGAVGYYILNTTTLANGTHTISWSVRDQNNNVEGIGSRYFTVQNAGGALTAAATDAGTVASATAAGGAVGVSAAAVEAVPADYSVLEVTKPVSDDAAPSVAFPESNGDVNVTTKETEQVEISLANWFGDGGTYEGYVVIDGRLRPLPVGSTLDQAAGVFKWQPGPGFVGNYKLVFLRKLPGGSKVRIPVNVTIAPKFESDK
jgi:fibronectin type III domain protein